MPKSMRDMNEPEMREYFASLARRVEPMLPPCQTGPRGKAKFVLLVIDEPGLVQYVSNCSRENMITFLRETAKRFETQDYLPRVEGRPS